MAARMRLHSSSAHSLARPDGKPWPALIVGGGPVGLYASALLSSFGVPSIMVERAPTAKTKQHPRSHYINSRSMELLRELGVEKYVREQTPPLDEWRHFRYCTSLFGTQIAAQDHAGDGAWSDLCAAAATEVAHLSQPKLERILRAEAERRAPAAGAQLLGGYTCAGFEQSADGVRAMLRRVGEDGTDSDAHPEVHVDASHMLACDGAHSSIRNALGLRLRGPPPLQHFKSVHFVAPELAPMLAALGQEAMLYFCFNRGAIAVLVAHNIAQGEWVAQLPFFPGLQDADNLDHEACTNAIAACIGGGEGRDGVTSSAVPFEVQSIGSWAMSAKVAQRLSLGRVHLLGDAAHQFPPAGAFGANTGLQDAHNLCWKLGAVHHGHADEKLIASYDLERRPVAVENAHLAVHNYHRGLRVANALGLPSGLPHALAQLAGSLRAAANDVVLPPPPGGGAHLPWGEMANTLGTKILDMGRKHLIEQLGHESPRPIGQFRKDQAKKVVDEGAALPLLFARHELGFVYPMAQSAAADDDASSDGPTDADGEPGADDEQWVARMEDERYMPSTEPGARLPHHWMTNTEAGGDHAVRLSTHDLIHDVDVTRTDGTGALAPALPEAHAPRLTLLIDAVAGGAWAASAAQLDASRARLRVVAIAAARDAPELDRGTVEQLVNDPCGGWAAKRQVDSCGALLVRPDGHVAWRCERLPPDAEAKLLLGEALANTLYQPTA